MADLEPAFRARVQQLLSEAARYVLSLGPEWLDGAPWALDVDAGTVRTSQGRLVAYVDLAALDAARELHAAGRLL